MVFHKPGERPPREPDPPPGMPPPMAFLPGVTGMASCCRYQLVGVGIGIQAGDFAGIALAWQQTAIGAARKNRPIQAVRWLRCDRYTLSPAQSGRKPGGAMPGSDVGGECLDRIDDRVEAPGAEQVEPVLRAGQLRVDDRVGRCGA
jgi:hypothetical protein